MSEEESRNRRPLHWRVLLVALMGLGGVGIWLGFQFRSDTKPSPEVSADPCEQLKEAVAQEDFQRVSSLVLEHPESTCLSPESTAAIAGQLELVGWLSAADHLWQQAIQDAPQVSRYRLKFSKFLFMTGRYQAAREQWVWLLQNGRLDLLALPLLGNENLSFSDRDNDLKSFAAKGISDPLVDLGHARVAMREKNYPKARKLLNHALAIQPELVAAQVFRGQLMLAAGESEQLRDWFVEHRERLRFHAEYWILQGRVCRAEGQFDQALRCFAEGFQRDPNSYIAVSQTGQLLNALNRTDEARVFLERAAHIQDYANICRTVHVGELPSESSLRKATSSAESLGCLREALAWSQVAHVLFPDSTWPVSEQTRFRRLISPGSDRHEPALLADNSDLLKLPLPRWSSPGQVTDHITQAGIQFENRAPQANVHFVYEDGADPETPETKLFEFTGGGVAVLDFDQDGLPDLYFTQGGPPPSLGSPNNSNSQKQRPTDRLYRNQGDGTFQDVTLSAGTVNRVYAQGCTVGDFNSDGFPDLYAANIGRNVLLQNNGDGTFSEHVVPGFSDVKAWTTSCLLVDLNSDGHPDIYDVNHVIPEGVHTRMCQRNGVSVPCGNSSGLKAEQDRLLINLGNGEFKDVTATCGIEAADGLGLGIVAADFDDSGRLSLFIANDARANFFFQNEGGNDHIPQFQEKALLQGLAFSALGRAQACMGIATGDANQDGLLDLFVTNFYADYNTLYVQQPGLIFNDATSVSGLERASYHFLGFGTQFLDADLDGAPDLVLTNGDVVDFSKSEEDRPYAQQPQFLHNGGTGRFSALPHNQSGEYFANRYLGRGLARLDWDADGKMDFAVSHIGMPAALVHNSSTRVGNHAKIRLVGLDSARDAVGAKVTLSTEQQSWTQQLTAGDGYMASNQRELIFGLGTDTTITEIVVKWPSGTVQRYKDFPINQTILLVETLPGLILPE